MTDDDVTNLMSMGFSEQKSRKALKINNNNLNEACEWLLVHGNAVDDDQATDETANASASLKLSFNNNQTNNDSSTEPKATTEATQNADELKVNSFKCDDCGMVFRNETEVTVHAGRTGHENFSESVDVLKPKTKEEIEEQKKKLTEKLVKIRLEKQEKEKQDQIEQEKARRKQGRQLNEIKQKYQEDELKRIAEEKRREKLADQAYKQKLREEIARDREQFNKKANNESETKTAQQPPVAAAAAPSVGVQEKKNYDECKIQIRLTDGKSIVQTFKAKEHLAAVRLWIEMNRTDGAGNFNIMQTFPRKVYTDEDMMRSLADLGLVPATTLVISKI